MVDLDVREDEAISNDKPYLVLEPKSKTVILVLDGSFEVTHLDVNQARSISIRSSLPASTKKEFIGCLKANVDLLEVSPNEMSDINPRMVCHQLNFNPYLKYVAK